MRSDGDASTVDRDGESEEVGGVRRRVLEGPDQLARLQVEEERRPRAVRVRFVGSDDREASRHRDGVSELRPRGFKDGMAERSQEIARRDVEEMGRARVHDPESRIVVALGADQRAPPLHRHGASEAGVRRRNRRAEAANVGPGRDVEQIGPARLSEPGVRGMRGAHEREPARQGDVPPHERADRRFGIPQRVEERSRGRVEEIRGARVVRARVRLVGTHERDAGVESDGLCEEFRQHRVRIRKVSQERSRASREEVRDARVRRCRVVLRRPHEHEVSLHRDRATEAVGDRRGRILERAERFARRRVEELDASAGVVELRRTDDDQSVGDRHRNADAIAPDGRGGLENEFVARGPGRRIRVAGIRDERGGPGRGLAGRPGAEQVLQLPSVREAVSVGVLRGKDRAPEILRPARSHERLDRRSERIAWSAPRHVEMAVRAGMDVSVRELRGTPRAGFGAGYHARNDEPEKKGRPASPPGALRKVDGSRSRMMHGGSPERTRPYPAGWFGPDYRYAPGQWKRWKTRDVDEPSGGGFVIRS